MISITPGEWADRRDTVMRQRRRDSYHARLDGRENNRNTEHEGKKKCCGCYRWKTLDRFSPNASGKFGVTGRCRPCRNILKKLEREKKKCQS